jgi:branched-subunit amino acid aminotransferase/4-amino-4-deoxychorismate lyase
MIQPSLDFNPGWGVFETLRVVDGVPLFIAAHQRELKRATAALGLDSDFDFEAAQADLPKLSGRWRWIVMPDEAYAQFVEEEWVDPGTYELSVSAIRVGSSNWDARFKTLSYLSHAQAWKMKSTDEVILLNEYGLMAGAARGNLFWRIKGQIFTPAHETGCRRGIIRNFVAKFHNVRSGHYPPSDLLEAEEIFYTNSMKGIVSVRAIKGRAFSKFPTADKLRESLDVEIAEQIAAARGDAGARPGSMPEPLL